MATLAHGPEAEPSLSLRAALNRRGMARAPLLISLVLAGVCLVAALRGIAWSELLTALRLARWELILLAIIIMAGSCFVRAMRWRLLLAPRSAMPYSTAYFATAAGYVGNNFLPSRMGELLRTALVSRATRLSVGYVLATAVAERVVDAAMLVLIALVAVSTLDDLPGWLNTATHTLAVLGALGLVVLWIAPHLERPLGEMLRRLPIRWLARLDEPLRQFLLGMRTLQHAGRAAGFLGLTILAWLTDTVVALIVARAFAISLAPSQAVILLAALGLASAVPSTPGYIGLYQFVAVSILVPFGIAQAQAIAFILAFQAVIYAAVTPPGILGIWRLGSIQLAAPPPSPGATSAPLS